MTPKELATKLNDLLPEDLFEEMTRFMDEGDISSLYEEMAEFDGCRHPENYTSVPYEVEYDLNYTGGSYSGVGQFVTVMSPTNGHEAPLFKKQTGIDPAHIVHFHVTDELYEKDD